MTHGPFFLILTSGGETAGCGWLQSFSQAPLLPSTQAAPPGFAEALPQGPGCEGYPGATPCVETGGKGLGQRLSEEQGKQEEKARCVSAVRTSAPSWGDRSHCPPHPQRVQTHSCHTRSRTASAFSAPSCRVTAELSAPCCTRLVRTPSHIHLFSELTITGAREG